MGGIFPRAYIKCICQFNLFSLKIWRQKMCLPLLLPSPISNSEKAVKSILLVALNTNNDLGRCDREYMG